MPMMILQPIVFGELEIFFGALSYGARIMSN